MTLMCQIPPSSALFIQWTGSAEHSHMGTPVSWLAFSNMSLSLGHTSPEDAAINLMPPHNILSGKCRTCIWDWLQEHFFSVKEKNLKFVFCPFKNILNQEQSDIIHVYAAF